MGRTTTDGGTRAEARTVTSRQGWAQKHALPRPGTSKDPGLDEEAASLLTRLWDRAGKTFSGRLCCWLQRNAMGQGRDPPGEAAPEEMGREGILHAWGPWAPYPIPLRKALRAPPATVRPGSLEGTGR